MEAKTKKNVLILSLLLLLRVLKGSANSKRIVGAGEVKRYHLSQLLLLCRDREEEHSSNTHLLILDKIEFYFFARKKKIKSISFLMQREERRLSSSCNHRVESACTVVLCHGIDMGPRRAD